MCEPLYILNYVFLCVYHWDGYISMNIPRNKLLLHLHMVEISTGRRFFAEELRRKPAEIGGPC